MPSLEDMFKNGSSNEEERPWWRRSMEHLEAEVANQVDLQLFFE